MGPYQAFCQEQRPLLERDICPGEREKLLGRLWKALSKAEKAHYKMEEVRPSPYSLFCQGQRPLLPPDLPGATREMVLGRLWAALSEPERAKYKAGGSSAPVPAPVPTALVLPTVSNMTTTGRGPGSEDFLEDRCPKGKIAKTAARDCDTPGVTPTTAPPALLALSASLTPLLVPALPSIVSTTPTANTSPSIDTNNDSDELLALECFVNGCISLEALEDAVEEALDQETIEGLGGLLWSEGSGRAAPIDILGNLEATQERGVGYF